MSEDACAAAVRQREIEVSSRDERSAANFSDPPSDFYNQYCLYENLDAPNFCAGATAATKKKS